MRCLRRWLRELEARLPNQAAGSSSWTISEIQEKLKAQQVSAFLASVTVESLHSQDGYTTKGCVLKWNFFKLNIKGPESLFHLRENFAYP